MERDTAAVFDELTRDMAAEIAARRRAEAGLRRRAVPRSILTMAAGTLLTSAAGVWNPFLGTLVFLLTVTLLARGTRRLLPSE